MLPITVQQLLNQFFFLSVGKLVFRLSVTWQEIATVLLFAVIIEHAFIFIFERRLARFSFPSLSTGFNLAFMLGTTQPFIYVASLFVGLGQKHLAKRFLGNHFLNPSNVAIVFALLAWPDSTYITLLDWGHSGVFAIFIALAGCLVLMRLGLLHLPFAFLAAYSLFSLVLLTHNLQQIWLQLQTAGFLLFAFFMITDPKTLPQTKLFGTLGAILTALLAVIFTAVFGPKEVILFASLSLASLGVPLWRAIEQRQSGGRARRLAPWLAAGAMAALLTAVYFSEWSLMRNLGQSARDLTSLSQNTVAGNASPVASPAPVSNAAAGYFASPDTELFAADWSAPHIVSRKLLSKPNGVRQFVQRPVLPAYSRPVTTGDLGEPTWYYAGVAVGDLNLDGYLDVVLSRVRHPLMVLLNDRKGGFLDATETVFGSSVPHDVEHVMLADIDNDRYLDLVLTVSQYYSAASSAIYRFDPAHHQFVRHFEFGRGKKTSGGISLADINDDKTLDFFVSYGIDWDSEKGDREVQGMQDEYYESGQGTWTESLTGRFDGEITRDKYAGMTALFVDFNLDGRLDFLLGNDFFGPSLSFLGTARRFEYLDRRRLVNNTIYSMSYFSADFDNDGVLELWENGLSRKLTAGREPLTKVFSSPNRNAQFIGFEKMEKMRSAFAFRCSEFTTSYMLTICHDQLANLAAIASGNPDECQAITSRYLRSSCISQIDGIATAKPASDSWQGNSERFPKQLSENVLLKLNTKTGKYENTLLKNLDALYTGWTFSAYPYDVDNDGRLDLYIGNGAVTEAHDENVLLINTGEGSRPFFVSRAKEWGVNFEDETRGAVIADFDGDGDGDMLLNNYLSEPMYLENESGGGSIQVELRSRKSNYYAIGATLFLKLNGSTQTRSITSGGTWNTSQPVLQSFGIPEGAIVKELEVRWPSGAVTHHKNLESNHRYVIYE